MLRRYAEQILSLYNYIDGIMVTDNKGVIEYYLTYRPDLIDLNEREILGKHIFEVYPFLNEENSSIMRVLRTGEPIYDEEQTLISYKGQRLKVVNTTMPIVESGKIVGIIDVSKYMDPTYQRKNISISLKENRAVENLYTIDDIISCSRRMELLKERIPRIASTDSTVLITGETGTGKELIAQSLHTSSERRSKKFISQNCAAIPSNLLESILFGTTKGSYTGAVDKPGLFEVANGGTLFLDEVNSMEIDVQSKLLRAIDEKRTTRIGGYNPVYVDIKIIAAINENPVKCIKQGRLREDLFYRLSVVQVNIPPLRERPEDIDLLTRYFIEYYNEKMGRDIIGLDEEVESIFNLYWWPGNVRELRNLIEGAFNICSGRMIKKKDVPKYVLRYFDAENKGKLVASDGNYFGDLNFTDSFSLNEELAKIERKYIEEAILRSKTMSDAAKLLGITKQALNYKLSKYELK